MSAQQNENVMPILGAKPTVKVVSVTPDVAARWLKRNSHNRRIRPATVADYARDMKAGAWKLTGEPVKFAPDGTLLDGQHRLEAVANSGVTVLMHVAYGIDPDAQKVMDTGRKRTAADALSLNGEQHAVVLAAAIRVALGIEADVKEPGSHEVTHDEVLTWLNQHPEIRHSAEIATQTARKCDCPTAMVTYTHWRLARIDPYEATCFWIAAADKVDLRKGDPVIALTNRFAEARRNRQTLSKRTQVSLIFRAWNTRRVGGTATFLRVNSPAGGLVPIPEPR